MKKLSLAIKCALLSGAALTATQTTASDKDLLDTLFENGVLTQMQYEKLVKQAEVKESATDSGMSKEMAKALEWASRVNISGDMRFRHENIDQDTSNGVKESRQRIRARLKVSAKINDEVDAGFRLVTAGGKTSSNQTIEGSFSGKGIYFDRAFINWHPDFAKGLTATFGKFRQPWYNVSSAGLIWDSDVNPEGVALEYKTKVGSVNVAATGGYFILEDGDTIQGAVNNNSSSDDLNMYHAGISASMKLSDAIKATLGSNAYIYNKETQIALKSSSQSGGLSAGSSFDSTNLEIYEVAGKVDINTGFQPIYVYGQYAINAAATNESQDTAWLAGFGTKYGPFKMDYNYRDTQEHAVADTFNDSDFNAGGDNARGHKVKLSYKISRNFSAAAAYFAAEGYNGDNTDTLQLDLKAKF